MRRAAVAENTPLSADPLLPSGVVIDVDVRPGKFRLALPRVVWQSMTEDERLDYLHESADEFGWLKMEYRECKTS